MQENEMLSLWKDQNQKLTASIQLNHQHARAITELKVQHHLQSMKPLKIFTIIAGLGWVGIGSALIYSILSHANDANYFFVVSATIQVLLTAIALVLYIYQLITLQQIHIDDAVAQTQGKLAQVRTTTLVIARVLFLQFPLWTTFYLNQEMFREPNIPSLILQGAVTLAFTCIAGWLFLNIKMENHNKKWFRLLFSGQEWEPLMKSMRLLDDLKSFKSY